MENKIYPIVFFLFSLCMLSCKKYLDEKPDKSLVTPNTIEDLQGILDYDYVMNAQTPGFGETSSDDYFLLETSYNSLDDFDQKAYTWRLKEYIYPNDWAYCYEAIYYSNYCLEQIEKVIKNAPNELKWNNVKGSALFYRAYYFLNLVWEYSKAYDDNDSQSDLGIVLRLNSDFNIPSARANVAETYDRIIKDLNESVIYLPDNPLHPMRPSKAASYAALARTYLSMRRYDSAFKYANLVLKIKNDLIDYNSPEVDPSINIPFQPFNKEIIFYTTQSYNYSSKAGSVGALIDSLIYFNYDDKDMRKTAFFRPNMDYQRFKGNYAAASSPFFSGIAVDEIYLIRSECNARAGRLKEAMADLNTLLEKRWRTGFVRVTASTSAQALAIVLMERRKELLMRGLRWIDIKRLNKEGADITLKRVIGTQVFSLPPNDDRYALPIPLDIIEQTGIQQN